MPIKSYLIFPHTGKEPQLLEALSLYAHCEVTPSDHNEVFVLVSDTPTELDDEMVLQKLNAEKEIHHIQFISGFITEPYEKERV